MRKGVVLLTWCLLAPGALAGPSGDDLSRLRAGEALTRPYSLEGLSGVETRFWVAATPEATYRILADTARLAEFMPNLHACSLLEVGDRYAVVALHGEQGEMVQRRTYEPPSRISWRLVRAVGLKDVKGRWLIEPAPGGVVLSYAVAVQPAVPIPRGLVDHFQRRSLPALVHNVRARIESGGRWIKPDYKPR